MRDAAAGVSAIGGVLPDAVVTVEAFHHDHADAVLFPEEELVIARAVDKRRREFTAGRVCARKALAMLGVPPTPLLPGERGAPKWPLGIVGAITHCTGYCAAAVSPTVQFAAVAIDAEPHGALPDGVLDHVAGTQEQILLAGLRAAIPDVRWDRLLFSAKESVYKAWFPLARRWLDFHDALVDLDPEGTFTAQLLVPDVPFPLEEVLTGRWQVRNGLVLTAIAVPAVNP
jgi:4'-phosphopantetheinyl transferase EntD